MSSSSDSEEENVEMLKEAIETHFLKDSMYSGESSNDKETPLETRSLPSLRRNVSADDDSYNFFKVSPEFQRYMSKQLSELLDKQLHEILVPFADDGVKKKKRKGGVRLLKTSSVLLKHREHESVPARKRVNESDFNEKDLVERCRTVAVNAEDILSKKDVKYWKPKPTAKVFSYKNTNGELLYQSPAFV